MTTLALDIERFFRLSVDMLCIATTSGWFKRVNPSFQRTLGWTEDELLSRPFQDFIHPDDVHATLAEIRHLRQGNPSLLFENRYRCKDGSYRTLMWTAYPEEGTDLLHAVARDVTAMRAAEVERERLIGELQEALANVKTLSGLLPICVYCKQVRNDEGYWRQIEMYLGEHSEAELAHGVCPACQDRYYPEATPP